MADIFVLHENATWVEPLREAFAHIGVEHAEWFLDGGTVNVAETPPLGVFYNRMSASSHTRGHRFAPEYTAAILAWLESHGRPVVNDSRALQLEISKTAQYAALRRFGVRTPHTVAVAAGADSAALPDRIAEVAQTVFGGDPVILKPNRGGKGLGVLLFESPQALHAHLASGPPEQPLDGIYLVQSFIQSPDRSIIRCEFVGGDFLYAVRVDASKGFELCPADVCNTDAESNLASRPQFEIIKDFDDPVLDQYRRFLAANGIGIAGIELIFDAEGRAWTYDVNTNTNYNPAAEAAAGHAGTERAGMRAIARHLHEVAKQHRIPAAA